MPASTLYRSGYESNQFARILQIFGFDLEHSISHLGQKVSAGFWKSSGLRQGEIDDYARFSAEIVHDERADTTLPNERMASKRLASE